MLFASFFSFSQSYQLDWVKTLGPVVDGASSIISIGDVLVDDNGNIYSAGYFVDTVDFDPGPGVFELSSTQNGGFFDFYDLFLQKLDSTGAFVWAKKFEAQTFPQQILGISLSMDANGDIIFVSQGYSAAGYKQSTYVYKIHETGNIIWAHGFGGGYMASGSSQGRGVTTDSLNNIYVTGIYKDTNVFGGITLISESSSHPDAYLMKLDISGSLVWIKTILQGVGEKEMSVVERDPNGNLYVTGYFGDTTDFDPGAASYDLVPVFHRDIFVAKYDPNGDFVWAKSFGSSFSGGSESDSGYDLKIDKNNDVVIIGKVQHGTIDFDPGVDTFNITNTSGGTDIFVEKLDVNGNFVWAKLMGGAYPYDEGYSIAIDSYNNIFITGRYSGTADFDPTPLGVSYLFGSGAALCGFVEKLDSNGDIVWVESITGSYMCESKDIYVDNNDVVYVSGVYRGTVDFDWSSGVDTIPSKGFRDGYLMKLKDPFAGLNSIVDNQLDATIYPNPTNGDVTLNFDNNDELSVRIVDLNGKVLLEEKNVQQSGQNFNINGKPGVYFMEVASVDSKKVFKVIKQ